MSETTSRIDPAWPLTRRRWLGGLSLLALGAAGADAQPVLSPAESAAAEAIRKRSEAVGIKDHRTGLSDHYFWVGDATAGHGGSALGLCEDLAATFLKHFQNKGFDVAYPRDRMAVVVLKDRDSYAAFKGGPVGDLEGGHYDVEANRLVVFDFHAPKPGAPANARRVNTFTLVHEAIHQLTYNTGLLDRKADVPVAVSEGLATYGELWTREPRSSQRIGQRNGYRLNVLLDPNSAVDWLPVERLLTDDGLFEDAKAEQAAYAEAWLLVYDLLQTSSGAKKLRAYLQALRPRRDPGHRVEDAQAALGNLVRLDVALKKRASLLRRG
jgi:hypothetical protein